MYLTGYTVSMVTTNEKKMIITCGAMIEHLCHAISVMGNDKEM